MTLFVTLSSRIRVCSNELLPTVNLHSRDAWVRSGAEGALRALAGCIAAPAAAKALLAHAFAHYNGANGKLSSSEDKIAVLNVRIRNI